jgi:hypothetical protein
MAVGLVVLAAAGALEIAHAQGKTFAMKISLPTINDPGYPRNFAAALQKDSAAGSSPRPIPQANSARFRGRSRQPSSAPSNA